MAPRRFITLALVLVTAVGASACGSSSKTTSSSAATTSSSTSAAATAPAGSPIVLGMICSCTGPQAGSLGTSGKVAQVWASYVNANGGINGHPVKMIVMDDGTNPATSVQDVKALVEQDHVMAIVGEVSLVDATWANYVASKGIPVVGGISVEAPFITNPDFYPSGTQATVMTVGVGALAAKAGKTHLGTMYCSESPVCAQVGALGKAAAALSGLKYTSQAISSTAPSYTAPCLAAKGAGVDALFIADSNPIPQSVAAACVQQGYKPQQVNAISTVANSWLTDPNLQGALISGVNANAFDSSLPAVQQFQAALNKYAPGLVSSSQFSSVDLWPWAGGQLFEAAAKAAKITPTSTPADVKKGLYALKNETLDGLAPPLNFTPGKPAFVPCYYTLAIKGNKLVSLNNNKPTCLSATQAAALAKAL